MNPCPASQSFTLTLQEQIHYCYFVHGRCHKVLRVSYGRCKAAKNALLKKKVCKNIYLKNIYVQLQNITYCIYSLKKIINFC